MRASSSRAHRYRCLIWTTRETEVNVSRPRRLMLRRTHPNTEDPPLPPPTLLGRKAKPGTETSSQFYCGRVSVCRFRISLCWERERRTITSCKRDIERDSDTGGEDDLGRSSTVKCERKDALQKKEKKTGFLKKGKKGGDNESTTGSVVAGKGRCNRGHFTLLVVHRCRVKSCSPWWKLQVLTRWLWLHSRHHQSEQHREKYIQSETEWERRIKMELWVITGGRQTDTQQKMRSSFKKPAGGGE